MGVGIPYLGNGQPEDCPNRHAIDEQTQLACKNDAHKKTPVTAFRLPRLKRVPTPVPYCCKTILLSNRKAAKSTGENVTASQIDDFRTGISAVLRIVIGSSDTDCHSTCYIKFTSLCLASTSM